jgi:hypothetical protein
MKFRLILLAMAAGLVLPLVAADAGALFDPGLNRAGAGAGLERGLAPTAENFGRNEDEGKCHRDDKGNRADWGDKCCGDKGDQSDKCRCHHDRADWDDRGDRCRCRDRDDRGDRCEKSPSKPWLSSKDK